MPKYSQVITDFWRAPFLSGDVLHEEEAFSVAVNPDLSDDRRVMVLETVDGTVRAVLAPAMAGKLGLERGQDLSASIFRQRLSGAGVTLHDADNVFYFVDADKQALLQESHADTVTVRQLTEHDGAIFAEFESSASEQDLDDAYVELDHWAVFGTFEQDLLVGAASAYPWQDAQIADIGVLTLAPFRGKGHARRVVRAICQYAYGQGCEPQYRCQLDNLASAAVAKAAGLTLFGTWEVVSPDSAE
jgi:RimJ/RimL family protein N-acetyltransferase